ncbi:Hypothetical protein CGLY_06830 [Corynebacterium glyciniphilum AJ 3170]|uniref:Uncharacterized protein n=1 Tax=Corynebacterium glyciniphilum AJ 3170 TaxID=1404245 RepID=X5EB23_9CORY|nr:hypothetical protein [Corynebacterium glyciniphilum]AHW63811.1 Hypothetical protein CGLY_06830 [Corynebacterium glyciniphilum AJ 3170]
MERQSTGIEWNELLPILLGYPSDSLHATLVMRGDGDSDVRYEVWRQGRKLRVEKDGSPDYICDGETTWSFEEATGVQGSDGRPVASDARKAVYCGPAQGLCAPRRSSDWQGSDFTTPEGPVTVEEFQGRDCWTVALKAPPRKAGPLRMWVDRDSGYPLGEVNESSEAGDYGRWFESPEIGIPLDDSLFTWDGPSLTQSERHELIAKELEVLRKTGVEWFVDNIMSGSLTASAIVDIAPQDIGRRDGGGFLARSEGAYYSMTRRGGEAAVGDDGDHDAIVRWSTAGYDWAFRFENPHVICDDAVRDELGRRFGGQG